MTNLSSLRFSLGSLVLVDSENVESEHLVLPEQFRDDLGDRDILRSEREELEPGIFRQR